ncbi:MAG: 4-hydroxy-3-methylbut-2-enyl diphosphate reductase, partial [Firmicutes bacterium]|nr:4-hydroxy-3-methylbut-2-enyl diphosphate reductase [Bacillota bacterium]
MPEIIRAKNSGFCFGVREAVKAAEKLIKDNKGKEGGIYTCGQLVHNADVTKKLEADGLYAIDGLDSVKPGDTVLIRAHGMPEEFYKEAEEKGVHLVDATCPFVAKIHKYVKDAHAAGKQCVIVGDGSHPEVIGINGWCENSALIVNSEEEADNVRGEQLYVVAQTTSRAEHFDKIVEILKKNNENVEVVNTICNATTERQISTAETAKLVDTMIVIGGKN